MQWLLETGYCSQDVHAGAGLSRIREVLDTLP
jgi:hypothetical protein